MSHEPAHASSRTDESRRNAFLDTATSVFARRGFEAPTMDELALACGCERRTLYRYFPSRDEFFWAAVERSYGRMVERFQVVFGVWESAKLPALARLRSWGLTYFEYSLDFPEAFRLVMAGRERAVGAHTVSADAVARADQEQVAAATGMAGHVEQLAALDQAMLGGIMSLAPLLVDEGLCEGDAASVRLWELLGVLIAIVEFHARYRGGGTEYPFGKPEGIKAMIERQVEAAFPREEKLS
jgi:AcrR family transcriptional regulator